MSESCGVKRSRGQATERRRQEFRRNGIEFVQFPAVNRLCEKRRTGDGRRASPTKETDFADHAAFDFCGDTEQVSADWIRNFNLCVGCRQFTGVARVLKVVEKRLGEHQRIIAAGAVPCNSGASSRVRRPPVTGAGRRGEEVAGDKGSGCSRRRRWIRRKWRTCSSTA